MGQVTGHGPPVAVLQAEHHLPRRSLERERGGDAAVTFPDGSAGQGEPTPPTEDLAGLVAPGTGSVEQHARHEIRRV
jgi:hypothetical protein